MTTAARSLPPPGRTLQASTLEPTDSVRAAKTDCLGSLLLLLLLMLGGRIQAPKWRTGMMLSGTLFLGVLWVACGGGGGGGVTTAPPPAPAVSLSPNGLTFSSQNAGTTSAAQTVTLTNTGNAALTITSIAASGDFAETNTCATSVPAAAKCAINVTFSPTKGGALSGQITITDNAAGSPQAASVSGTGVGTTAGAYKLTVTATAGQLSHQTVLDLTVQ